MSEETRVVLVTGGAARVGATIVRTFHQHGFHVCLHYRSSVVEKLRTLGGLITIGNTKIEFLIHDIPEPSRVAARDSDEADEENAPDEDAEIEALTRSASKPDKKRRHGRRRVARASTAAAATTSHASRSSGPLLLVVFAVLGLVTLVVVTHLRRTHRDEDVDAVAAGVRDQLTAAFGGIDKHGAKSPIHINPCVCFGRSCLVGKVIKLVFELTQSHGQSG